MKITIDVKRAEQSFDLDRGVQQNYLVVELGGQEIRIPCDEEQMGAAIRECVGRGQTVPAPEPVPVYTPSPAATTREFSFTPDEDQDSEEKPVSAAPAVFVLPEPRPAPVPKVAVQQPATSLRPVARQPVRQADDAGISQG